jgi:6-hydroxy-3-succinoylpyridine 3-monooxygenase
MAAFFCEHSMDKDNNRSIVYIDGFNLYYGAVKNTPWKWLNIEKYFTLLRDKDDIKTIKYFTARITGSHKPNQEAFIKALLTLNTIQIIYGLFKFKKVKCLVKNCTYSGTKTFNVPEEKRTDVNIAAHMLEDAFYNRCDKLILVTGDSDLVPAVKAVKRISPKKKDYCLYPSK